jgi:formylmethanofuran dehydrogenase subunit E
MPDSYEGMYSSGTMSYMLDPSSMVLYTVDASYEGSEFWSQPKINRQMFHWGEEKLVQGRLYPQDNDNCAGGYTPYRNIVQEIVSSIFNFPNLWVVTKGIGSAGKYINTYGTHYRDYHNYDNCSLSRPKGSENENYFQVGADPICIECGERHETEDNINCCIGNGYYCENCGEWVDEEDAIEINGCYYCRECVEYCERCDTYHRGESYYIDGEDRYVCEYCAENYYIYCDECGKYVNRYDVTYVPSVDMDVCDECLSKYYERCDKCGELYYSHDLSEHDGKHYCDECYEEISTEEESEEA